MEEVKIPKLTVDVRLGGKSFKATVDESLRRVSERAKAEADEQNHLQ